MQGANAYPGSIKNQIGFSLNSIRECVEREDVEGLANHVAFLVAIASPKLDAAERKRFELPEMPEGKDKYGHEARRLFRACMTLLADLLCILSERGLYSWNAPPVGDARGIALRDEPDGEEPGEVPA